MKRYLVCSILLIKAVHVQAWQYSDYIPNVPKCSDVPGCTSVVDGWNYTASAVQKTKCSDVPGCTTVVDSCVGIYKSIPTIPMPTMPTWGQTSTVDESSSGIITAAESEKVVFEAYLKSEKTSETFRDEQEQQLKVQMALSVKLLNDMLSKFDACIKTQRCSPEDLRELKKEIAKQNKQYADLVNKVAASTAVLQYRSEREQAALDANLKLQKLDEQKKTDSEEFAKKKNNSMNQLVSALGAWPALSSECKESSFKEMIENDRNLNAEYAKKALEHNVAISDASRTVISTTPFLEGDADIVKFKNQYPDVQIPSAKPADLSASGDSATTAPEKKGAVEHIKATVLNAFNHILKK